MIALNLKDMKVLISAVHVRSNGNEKETIKGP